MFYFFLSLLLKTEFDLYRKTALLQRFAQDYFSTDYVATIGVGKNFLFLFFFLFLKTKYRFSNSKC